MEIKVLGCHGGETPKHRTSSFVLDGRLAIDAGAITSGLTLREQNRLRAVLVSHAHMDHVRDLATLADNRCQTSTEPLQIAGTVGTLRVLRKHFFNGLIWPDFSKIPLCGTQAPTIEWLPLRFERAQDVAGYGVRAVKVSHTIESAAFIVERGGHSIAYSGDTGPTERLWTVLGQTPTLRAIMMEVSFPDSMAKLAKVSGHHTPGTLARDLAKLRGEHNAREMPVLAYHIKPAFQREVERELARLRGLSLDVMALGDDLIV